MTDYETWLIDTGDEIINQKSDLGYKNLSATQKAIYCFWVIDYAIRNSGTLAPVNELHASAIDELNVFAQTKNCMNLKSLISSKSGLVENYYSLFSAACAELEYLYENN